MRRAAILSAWSAVAAWSMGACTFPDFVVLPATGGPNGAGQGATAAGGGETEGGSSSGSPTKAGAASGGSANTGATSDGGDGGEPGEPIPVDIGPCGQRLHALHCYDHELDDDETDVDCGGSRCEACSAEETCSVAHDCATSSCVDAQCARLFSVQYVPEIADENTSALRFKAVVSYAGKDLIALKDVQLRYYFSRNSVTEPILPGGSAIAMPSQADISGAASWSIVRQLRGNGITNDAYLEIGFDKTRILGNGESVEITASAGTGDAKSLFNQKTHYSFDSDTALHETKKLVVYYKGKRAWGHGPEVDDPPSCLHLGVNLDGPAVTVGGDPWLTSPASVLARYINPDVVLKPATDQGREDMLRAGFFFHDDTFSYAIDNGRYALLAYAWSADGAETGTLSVQDEERDAFRATSFAGGGPWVALGPYRVTVSDGKLKLAAKGDLRIGGIELRLLDE
jgi:hypothetical protein